MLLNWELGVQIQAQQREKHKCPTHPDPNPKENKKTSVASYKIKLFSITSLMIQNHSKPIAAFSLRQQAKTLLLFYLFLVLSYWPTLWNHCSKMQQQMVSPLRQLSPRWCKDNIWCNVAAHINNSEVSHLNSQSIWKASWFIQICLNIFEHDVQAQAGCRFLTSLNSFNRRGSKSWLPVTASSSSSPAQLNWTQWPHQASPHYSYYRPYWVY